MKKSALIMVSLLFNQILFAQQWTARFNGTGNGLDAITGMTVDKTGNVYGMQYATNHLHLGFDLKDKEILQDGKKAHVSNYPFLHVGLCVHADKIKQFLSEHNIAYDEAL